MAENCEGLGLNRSGINYTSVFDILTQPGLDAFVDLGRMWTLKH